MTSGRFTSRSQSLPRRHISEHPQMQDESISSIQETLNSQFRLVLSVTPCVPRISSLESVNDNTSPLLFSPTSSLTFIPTPCAWRVSYVVGCWNVVAILSMADLVCHDCMQKLCSAWAVLGLYGMWGLSYAVKFYCCWNMADVGRLLCVRLEWAKLSTLFIQCVWIG